MTTVRLAALAFAITLSGSASLSAGEVLAPATDAEASDTVAHTQAWGLTKLRTHSVKYHKRYKVRQRRHQARLRTLTRKRYWGSWSPTYDRFDGFAFHGDGFRTSGQYQ
ncbi:MAG: hypothetical protein GY947_09325 [Rhodobacteraceae bacterium]|nr:hypothetical protein [Paracoccaceae bacterium]